MPRCKRCNGKGVVIPHGVAALEAQCPLCFGLKSYETAKDHLPKKFEPRSGDGVFAVHSSLKLEDVIALLPEGENLDDKDD